jgi:hypothetical protein
MSVDWGDIIAKVGSTTVIIAALAWLRKAVFGPFLSRDIEAYKNQVKQTALLALQEQKANLDRQRRSSKPVSLPGRRAPNAFCKRSRGGQTLSSMRCIAFGHDLRTF